MSPDFAPGRFALRPRFGWGLRALLFLALALTLARTLSFHRSLILYPYPLDLAEPAQGRLAQGVAAGYSTGDLEAFPVLSEYYGPVYSQVTGALCRYGLACGLRQERFLSAVFIALIVALLGALCRRLGAPWLHTAALSLWVYALLLIHFTPIARPDALGTLLWFAGLGLPFLAGYGFLSLAAAAVLFTLAGLTKIYFCCGPLFLALALALGRERRPRALAFFLAAQAFCLAAAAFWIRRYFPHELYEAILPQAGNLDFDRGHMLLQVWVVLVLASPCFVPMLVVAWRDHRSLRDAGSEWGLYGALGLALFVSLLGGATGGLFTYLIQLSVLPFAVWFAGSCRKTGPWSLGMAALLTVNALGGAKVAVHKGFGDGTPVTRQWERADALVDAARHPVVCSDLDLAVEARGLPVFDTGLSESDWLEAVKSGTWEARLFPDTDALTARYRVWQDRTRRALLDPGTDLVVVSDYGRYDYGDILRARYRPLGRLQIAYPQCGWAVYWLTFYVPKAPGPPLAQVPHRAS